MLPLLNIYPRINLRMFEIKKVAHLATIVWHRPTSGALYGTWFDFAPLKY